MARQPADGLCAACLSHVCIQWLVMCCSQLGWLLHGTTFHDTELFDVPRTCVEMPRMSGWPGRPLQRCCSSP